MSNRHLSRSVVLQTLYEWDFETSKYKSSVVTKEMTEKYIALTIEIVNSLVLDNVLEYGGAFITDTEIMEQEKQSKNE